MNTGTGQDDDHKNDGDQRSTPPSRRVSVVEDRINSRELFAGARQIIIEHGTDIYTLRLTAQNKLILTK